MPTCRCRTSVTGRVCSEIRTSSTTQWPTATTVGETRPCASFRSVNEPIGASTKRRQLPARFAHSVPNARPHGEADGLGAVSTRRCSTESATITQQRRTPKRCASGRSGLSRSSPKRKTGAGLRHFRLRGLEKVNIQAQVIAAGQNLKRLLSQQGWGRRPWPGGAAGMVIPAAKLATPSR